ncbi:MAG TPA: penicillin-binding transpeptidase domain-containing protein [Acidobacteriota bacterium]|nr:penicillin-binding transpeptidase domain-containing protein [Acidobacteriota bacterium]
MPGLKSGRIVLVILGITFWSFLILIRLVQLQIFEHRSFVQLAIQRQQVTRSIHAPRGVIYDRHMAELATSVAVSTAVAEPRRIQDPQKAAQELAAILDLNPQELLGRMMDPARQSFMVIKRRIDPQAEKQIEALGIDGVYFVDESMRVYPNRELACQVLGFVNMNGDGGSGIELQYDKDLKGTEGVYSFDVDARRKSFRVNIDKPPTQGRSLVLSIDKSIQYIADREVKAAVEKAQARAGVAIVMESETGRILALSNYPQFNCNTYNRYEPDAWRNRAISDIFEPGSTFKVVVATAALEAGLTRPEEMIDCQMGTITIGGHLFHDHKAYGLLSFSQILEYSSNVGASKLGLRLGQQGLYEALRNFGFGSRSGIDLPGEIIGLVRDWHNWSGLSIGAISFGQEVGVTSVQILTAINAIANGGYRVRPTIVDRIIDENGDLVFARAPERTRLMSPRTAEAVCNAFEGVVLRGTGKRAALEGYRAAGKTGTAQKIVNGQYSESKYVSSFIGFAPLPQPKITVLVQIDEPKGSHYGGDVSAPFFQKIAQETLMLLKIPPDQSLPLRKIAPLTVDAGSEDYLPNAIPIEPLQSIAKIQSEEESPREISVPVGGELIVLPDFRGMAKRKVLDRCMDLGIRLQANGSGVAVYQWPVPGSKVQIGATLSVTFAKGRVKDSLPTTSASLATQHSGLPLSAAIRP